MTEKIVTGRFRANLALIFSILALAISLVAFHQTGNQSGLKAEIENLQKKMIEVKEETADRLEKVRQETGQVLDKLGNSLKYNGESE
jgi:hypothetical protein